MNDDDLIPLAVAAYIRKPMAAQPELGSGLSACRNFQIGLPGDGRYPYRAPEGGLGKGNRSLADDIHAVALKESMVLHLYADEEVSSGPAHAPGFPFSGNAQAGTAFYSRGDIDVKLPFAAHLSFALTGPTGARNDTAGATAPGTGVAHAEDAVRLPYLAGAVAVGTGFRLRALGSARP